ncbi:MAG: hypothetical protein JNN17_23240 [Verrucomicrobiaceae bacterium]|nr:hypothetical protein [Verrucomicrobiaceae bacterium]
MKTHQTCLYRLFVLGSMLATPVFAQQTLNDLTTINGNLLVNPPPANTDAVTLDGSGLLKSFLNPGQIEAQMGVTLPGGDYLTRSALTPGGLFLNTGREATSSLGRQDWSGLVRLNPSGSLPGMEFFTDYVEGTQASPITGSSPLHYTWHRPLSGSGLSEDISLRSAAIMRLGGADNALTLFDPADATKKIVLNPATSTITLNGRQVVTQSDAGSLAMGDGTLGSGYASAAFGIGSTASGSASLTSGQGNVASGYASAAIGAWTFASGSTSMALGFWAWSVGDSSVALGGPNIMAAGLSSFATGSWSTAVHDRTALMGYGLKTGGPGQVVLGQWNDFSSPGLPGDLLFVIGNGLPPAWVSPYTEWFHPELNPHKSNALEVQLSGRTTIRHKNHADTSPPEALNVLGTATISRGLTVNGPATITGGVSLAAPVSVAGAAEIEGTLNVTGFQGTQGTITARKVRVQPGGDLPMDAAFQNDGGLGQP